MCENIAKICVIAGTPVDTQMGVDFVLNRGLKAEGHSLESNTEDQNLFQFLEPHILTEKVLKIIRDLENRNIFRTMIYCNSLSAAIDTKYLRNSQPKSIVITPLDIYKELALKYKKITLWAANGQCLSAIEHIFYEQNPTIDIMGVSMLPVIKAIEEKKSSEYIISQFDIISLSIKKFNPDSLILGCTHLPYLQPELSKALNTPIVDPAEEMLRLLTVQ